MHIKFPEKTEKFLQYLKLKLLPNTLFFRTMLLIFVPLIMVFLMVIGKRLAKDCQIISPIISPSQ